MIHEEGMLIPADELQMIKDGMRLTMGPTDVLVVRLDVSALDSMVAERVREIVMQSVGVEKVLVIDNRVEISVLRPPERKV